MDLPGILQGKECAIVPIGLIGHEHSGYMKTLRGLSTGVTGTLQKFMPVSHLERVDLNTTDLVVGKDHRLYSPRFGLIECMAVKSPSSDAPNVYVDKIDWKSYPPLEELNYLFNTFFKNYDREVLMLVGRMRDHSGWLYYVPKQVGTSALVTWDSDDEEMGEFSDKAQWIGTIHIHPGSDCTPSQTDIDDWAEPEKSGLHLIFGRNGSYTINGSIAGNTFQVCRGNLGGVERSPVPYLTSHGRSLEELLTKPKPPPKFHFPSPTSRFGSFPGGRIVTSRSTIEEEQGQSYVERHLHVMRVSPINHDELKSLRMVSHGGRYYILTESQYTNLEELCVDVCPVPTVGNLSIRPVNQEGGK